VNTLRRRLGLDRTDDQGLSLIEVVVAMLVFAIVALGVAYSLITTLHTAKDARGREVALNLAAQTIDAARSVTDIFDPLLDTGVKPPTTMTVPGDGTVYTITREVEWVTSNGSDADCGSGGGTLLYKEINVQVTWAGMVRSNPVRADTIISPSSTINDPALGTILVSVHTASGAPVPGVAITTTPSTGSAIPVTDGDGCSYILKVPPGSYSVSASLAGYIDVGQDTTPTYPQPIPVTAGSTSSAGFNYDKAATVQATYATNYSSLVAKQPTNLNTTFTSTNGSTVIASTTSAVAKTFSLYPGSYTVAAGKYVPSTAPNTGCVDSDPSQWLAGTNSSGQSIASPPPASIAVSPGSLVNPVGVPEGVVQVTLGGSSKTLTATNATPPAGTGDPGCALPTTYTFGNQSGTILLALPFGSWTFTFNGSVLSAGKVALGAGVNGKITGNIATLDPRVVTP
jgi:prepilin-type N-terminal cleavage/methylation domain-containing protein